MVICWEFCLFSGDSAGKYHDPDPVVAKSDLQKTFDKDSQSLPARAMKKTQLD
jgi:hypothetical protein